MMMVDPYWNFGTYEKGLGGADASDSRRSFVCMITILKMTEEVVDFHEYE